MMTMSAQWVSFDDWCRLWEWQVVNPSQADVWRVNGLSGPPQHTWPPTTPVPPRADGAHYYPRSTGRKRSVAPYSNAEWPPPTHAERKERAKTRPRPRYRHPNR